MYIHFDHLHVNGQNESVHVKTAITLYLTFYLQLYKLPEKICRKIPLFITINVQDGSCPNLKVSPNDFVYNWME